MNGRGLKRSAVDAHVHLPPFRLHAAMRGAAGQPLSFDQRTMGIVPSVKNQGGSSACWAHRTSTCISITLAGKGDAIAWTPSEADIYRAAREVERARVTPASQRLPALTDGGTNGDDGLAALSIVGIRPRSVPTTSDGRNSDVEMATVNQDQQLGDLEVDRLTLVPGAHGIDPAASDADQQIGAALVAGLGVGVDAFVDMAFENWSSGMPAISAPDLSDRQGGGHAITIIGWRTNANGEREWLILNEWDETWGDRGCCWVSTAWLRASWTVVIYDVRRSAA